MNVPHMYRITVMTEVFDVDTLDEALDVVADMGAELLPEGWVFDIEYETHLGTWRMGRQGVQS